MTVIHLEQSSNYLEQAGRCYMVLTGPRNHCHVVSGKCAHRGGPLHLGETDESGRFIVCPWHKNKTNIARLVEEELPSVRVPGRITVVLDSDAQEPAISYRRKMLLECSAALAQLQKA